MKYLVFALLSTIIMQANEPPRAHQIHVTVLKLDRSAASKTASPPDSISVIGMVNSPRAIKSDREISILDAIAAAGGLNSLAARTRFRITGINGVRVSWRCHTDLSLDSDNGKEIYSRIMIKPGETVEFLDSGVL